MASLFSRQALLLRRKLPRNTAARVLNSPFCSAASVHAPTLSSAENSPEEHPVSSAALDLDDAERLFSAVPTARLLRAAANLHVAAFEPAVDLGSRVMESRLMETPIVRSAVLGIVRHTFFEHFCAGEDSEAAAKAVMRLREVGIRGMLVYALEYASTNEACDRNLEGFITTVRSAKSLPPSSASFIIAKITAIWPMKVLERVSDLLRWQHKRPWLRLPWKVKSLPVLAESSPTYHTRSEPPPLSSEEERDLRLGHERLDRLCRECADAGLPLSIDAEHSAVQPAIDYLTYAAAVHHNSHGALVVYATVQAYLRDARERLEAAAKAADDMGVALGFKVVRGAYMSSEARIAAALGHHSPVHSSIGDTHRCFDDCVSLMMERIAAGPGGLVLASHNVDSAKLAAAKAHEVGMEKVKRKLEFAQLYGMAESLSFGVRNAGFQVSKYMPFGPVDKVIPYLLRRAEENRGLLSASTHDRQLMRTELMRRLKAVI